MKTIQDLLQQNIEGKTILIRADLNVPLDDKGNVSDSTRIEKFAPTAIALANAGAKIILISHLGRPKGQTAAEFSLQQIVPALSDILGQKVEFANDCISEETKEKIKNLPNGKIILLENLRFYKEETENNEDFAKKLSIGADYFVNDAFGTAHRAHASTAGITKFLPSYAGLLVSSEVEFLTKAVQSPARPAVAIVGGAKVSSKLDVLKSLIIKMDKIVIGGAMANTFLLAKGLEIGTSLCEKDLIEDAKKIIQDAQKNNCEIILPIDVVVSEEFSNESEKTICKVQNIPANTMALDFGPETIEIIKDALSQCKTIMWNGPLGAFELKGCEKATFQTAEFIAHLSKENGVLSVVGGGDSVSAVNKSGVAQDISYISTAGGAFLEWLEGKQLPGIIALG